MTDLSKAVAFFDIGNTLASARVSATGNSIEELIVFPDVPPVLEELREQAQLAAKIVAVFQMDMIGYDLKAGRTFELHAGFTPTPAVQSRSIKLAQLIAAMIPEVSPTLPAPQLYPGGAGQSDPAENRSDHSSFQIEDTRRAWRPKTFSPGRARLRPLRTRIQTITCLRITPSMPVTRRTSHTR
jgi:hypothetical protein